MLTKSSLMRAIAHAFIGQEHFVIMPRLVDVPQSQSRAVPSLEHAARKEFYELCEL